ncbi:group II intron maturase-specific domain-containing protein [Actinomadura monticuli]|uniref:Group II intron maturase-specific domain-containing protein n=1 Tax=Actinomadura monticuli TaxID=3097367 RepID=A0ABV4Q4W0_9ACTN
MGELVRYADDGVVLCRSMAQARTTKVVELREGREGLDFLGCHFRARFSGRVWEKYGKIRYYLHRWPSQAAMKKLWSRVHELTDCRRSGTDVRAVIADLNPILRGWGNYFRTGNAAAKFCQIDRYVVYWLHHLMVRKRGRNLRAGGAAEWNEEWFNGHGLYRLRGTIRYPGAA